MFMLYIMANMQSVDGIDRARASHACARVVRARARACTCVRGVWLAPLCAYVRVRRPPFILFLFD